METNSTLPTEDETPTNDTSVALAKKETKKTDDDDDKEPEYPEFVREMIEVTHSGDTIVSSFDKAKCFRSSNHERSSSKRLDALLRRQKPSA